MMSQDKSNGFFESMRRAHPLKLGDLIDGKKVVATFWSWSPEAGNVPMYRVEGNDKPKMVT